MVLAKPTHTPYRVSGWPELFHAIRLIFPCQIYRTSPFFYVHIQNRAMTVLCNSGHMSNKGYHFFSYILYTCLISSFIVATKHR